MLSLKSITQHGLNPQRAYRDELSILFVNCLKSAPKLETQSNVIKNTSTENNVEVLRSICQCLSRFPELPVPTVAEQDPYLL